MDLDFIKHVCENVVKNNYKDLETKQMEINFLKMVVNLMERHNFNEGVIISIKDIIHNAK